jgi:ferredoxin-nitrite reductase
MSKIEDYKREKDGLDVLADLPRFVKEGWESISEAGRERLKWLGIFFRRRTAGDFMMRIRIPNGLSRSAQFRTIAEISREFGKGFADITTRQQIQLRWFRIEHVPAIWERLDAVGLTTLQTGMDNIRNVMGCPVAGLTPNELFDASPVVGRLRSCAPESTAFSYGMGWW